MAQGKVPKKDWYVLKRKGLRGEPISIDTRLHPEVLNELENGNDKSQS